MVWSFTEVVSKLPPWRDVVVLGVPLLENAIVFSGDQDQGAHQAQERVGVV